MAVRGLMESVGLHPAVDRADGGGGDRVGADDRRATPDGADHLRSDRHSPPDRGLPARPAQFVLNLFTYTLEVFDTFWVFGFDSL